jgi:hypothetical protein
MRFEEIIKKISLEFAYAWNLGDLEKMTSFLTNDICLQSPNLSRFYPGSGGNTIVGKQNVVDYFKTLIETRGRFQVDQISIIKENDQVITKNKVVGKNIFIKEIFTINEYGKIKKLIYEYNSCPFPKTLLKNKQKKP